MRITLLAILSSAALAAPAKAATVNFFHNSVNNYVDVFYTVSAGGEFTNWDLRVDLERGSILDPNTNIRSDDVTQNGPALDTFVNTVFSSVGAGAASHVFTEYHPGSFFPPVPAQPAPAASATPPNPDQLRWSVFDTATGDGNIPGAFPYHMARVVFAPDTFFSIGAVFYDTTNAGVGEAFVGGSFQFIDVYSDGMTRTDISGPRLSAISVTDQFGTNSPTTHILAEGFSRRDAPNSEVASASIRGSSLLENRAGVFSNEFKGSVYLEDSATFIMSGGSIEQLPTPRPYRVFAFGKAGVEAIDQSTVQISGGMISVEGDPARAPSAAIRLSDDASLTISGGAFTAVSAPILVAGDASATTIFGGSFTATDRAGADGGALIRANDSAVVDIFGGSFTAEALGLDAAGQSVINVHGDEFQLDGLPVGPGFIPQAGLLTGVLRDGSPFSLLSAGRVFLNVIPEPTGGALALIGLGGWFAMVGRESQRRQRHPRTGI